MHGSLLPAIDSGAKVNAFLKHFCLKSIGLCSGRRKRVNELRSALTQMVDMLVGSP